MIQDSIIRLFAARDHPPSTITLSRWIRRTDLRTSMHRRTSAGNQFHLPQVEWPRGIDQRIAGRQVGRWEAPETREGTLRTCWGVLLCSLIWVRSNRAILFRQLKRRGMIILCLWLWEDLVDWAKTQLTEPMRLRKKVPSSSFAPQQSSMHLLRISKTNTVVRESIIKPTYCT